MNTSDEALRLIRQGRKIHQLSHAEKMNPGIFGVGVHDDELAGRPLGDMDLSRLRGVLVSALNDLENEGLSITPEGLARLVDTRLRRLSSNTQPSDEVVAREIEFTLDLVEQCQWRIKLRKAEWKMRAHRLFRPWFERPLTAQETASRERIESMSYPLDFHRGLIFIGVSGDNPRQREKRYLPCFHDGWIANAMISHQYGNIPQGGCGNARSLDDFVQPTETENRKAFEERKRMGWPDKDALLWQREYWQRWKISNVKAIRSKAGKASGTARKKATKRQE